MIFVPELSDFDLGLHQSLADQGFAKSLDRSTGMFAVFANPPPSRYRHFSSEKIAQLRLSILQLITNGKSAMLSRYRI